jgi:hypothetical protein
MMVRPLGAPKAPARRMGETMDPQPLAAHDGG